MFVVIFGRPGCPFCVKAKDLAEDLKSKRDDFNFRYVDIHAEGISKADLEKSVGKPVETVPQIFIDEKFSHVEYNYSANGSIFVHVGYNKIILHKNLSKVL